MNDALYELIVARRPKPYDLPVRILVILVIVAIAVLGMPFFGFLSFVVAVLAAILAYYFIFPRLNVEYEYMLLNHDLQIDVIYNREKRKKLKSFDIQTAEIIASEFGCEVHLVSLYDETVIENEEDLDQIDPSLSYDCVIQTTFSSEKLARFKKILSDRGVDVKYTNNICMASTRRRQAVSVLSRQCDTVFVIGEPQSANTTALYNLALSCGVKAFMIDGPESITDEMLDAHDIGICAGASVSPKQVSEVISFLESRGGILLPSSGGNSAS